MGLNLRKTIVGLAVLAVLLGVYVAYTRLRADIPVTIKVTPPPDSNTALPSAGETGGRIAGTGIGPLVKGRFIHTGPNNEVDRIFGFEELYHSGEKLWEVSHPYMTMYEPGFKCSVTAEKAQVQVDSAFERPVFGDASFSGNVVIHIVSTDANDVREAYLYLDDVAFKSEKSRFSSSGAVRFLSRTARLTGRGLELIYDGPRARVELFSVRSLESLRFRSEAFRTLSIRDSRAREKTTAQPQKARSGSGSRSASSPAPAKPQETAYECILWKDVRMVTPEQIVRAQDMLSITNLMWSGPKTEDANRTQTASASAEPKRKAEPNEPRNPPLSETAVGDSGSSALALDALPDSLFDIVVTCKGGLVARPIGATSLGIATADAPGGGPSDFSEPNDPIRQIIMARNINFDASTMNGTLAAPVEMRFWVDPNSAAPAKQGAQKMLAVTTARKDVRYVYAAHEVVLEDCVTNLYATEPNATTEYRLASPRLALSLAEDANATSAHAWGPAVKVRHVTASGGSGSSLRMQRKTAKGIVAAFEMQGATFDYLADDGSFAATGPGQIWLYNTEEPTGKTDPNAISLRRPCYAVLRDFDRLAYSATSHQIVADSKAKLLRIDYFPIEKGRTDRQIKADIGHVVIELAPTADGRMELVSLAASDGIAYQEQDRANQSQFDGSTLFYDYRKGLITIRGDEDKPCYFNGNRVRDIEMNVKTGRVMAHVVGPGAVSVK
jgi:hypothetical protein